MRAKATVRNGSDEVITNVHVRLLVEDADLVVGGRGYSQTAASDRLLPGAVDNVETMFDIRLDGTHRGHTHLLFSEAEFTDAAGVRWLRDRNHNLIEVTPGQLPGP